MKTILYYILLLSSFTLNAQWEWISPHPQGNLMYDLFFVNIDTGYAVGNYGSIIRTCDNGANWEVIRSFKNEHYRSVFFLNSKTGWVAGLNGILIKTEDGGNTWQTINTGTIQDLRKICFINQNTGFIVGDSSTIMKTTTGGNSWFPVNSSLPFDYLNLTDIQFSNPDTGYLLAHEGYYSLSKDDDNWMLNRNKSYLYKSVNGGITWNIVTLPSGISKILSISCLTSDTLLISPDDSGIGYVSTNGGTSWNGLPDGGSLLNIKLYKNHKAIGHQYYTSPDYETMWYEFSSIFKAGGAWFPKETNIYGPLTSIYFFDTGYGFILNQFGEIAKNTDLLWNSWVHYEKIFTYYCSISSVFNSVEFINNDTGFVIGLSLLRTYDNGQNWEGKSSSTKMKYDLKKSNNNILYVSCEKGVILKSRDYYNSYETINPGYGNEISYREISIPDSSLIFVAGDSGIVIKTQNQGTTWEKINTGILTTINSIYFINKDTGFFASQNGLIKRTINQGATWDILSTGESSNMNRLYFINQKLGFCVGNDGIILKTTDYGNSWQKINSSTTDNLSDISFNSNGYGIIVGENKTVLESVDSGSSWSKIPLYIDEKWDIAKRINSCYVTDSVVYICGFNNIILRYTPTWLITPTSKTPIPTEQPLKIYPNPTGNYIEIALPNVQGRLSCTLSTIDGREVIRQDLSEGNRRVSTEGLALGIYLVRVCNGERCWSGRLVRR